MPKGLSNAFIIVIAHGKSERIVCESLRSNLRIPLIIESHNNGDNSIQVNGLLNWLSKGSFSSYRNLTKTYPKLPNNKNILHDSVRIYPIMDLDDCDLKKQKLIKMVHILREHYIKNI